MTYSGIEFGEAPPDRGKPADDEERKVGGQPNTYVAL